MLTYEGRIMEIDGSKHAVHRDGEGQLHVVTAVCPHMGCIVHWNTAEQSWDCPCHGSRFTKDGEVLEGPAIDPLKKPGFNIRSAQLRFNYAILIQGIA